MGIVVRSSARVRSRCRPSTSRLRPRRWSPSARHALARRRSAFALSARISSSPLGAPELHRIDADRGSTPVLRVQNRAHLSMLPLSSASLRAPPRVREVAFAPPRPRSALIRPLSRSRSSRDVRARARRMFVVRRSTLRARVHVHLSASMPAFARMRVGRRSSSPCSRPLPAPRGAFSGARSPRAAFRSVRLNSDRIALILPRLSDGSGFRHSHPPPY